MSDVNDVIYAIDECQLNMNNIGNEWYTLVYNCQTLLDATGDSTSGENYPARPRDGNNDCVSCGAPPRPPALDPSLHTTL